MATTMSAITGAVTSTVTAFSSMADSWADVITGNELMLFFCVGVPLVGIGVGLLKRLISVR